MNPDIAKAALQFLSRSTLQGTEVQAFVAVCNALNAIANPAPAPAPSADPTP